MQSCLIITIKRNWNLEKQEDIEGCSKKSKKVREKGNREV